MFIPLGLTSNLAEKGRVFLCKRSTPRTFVFFKTDDRKFVPISGVEKLGIDGSAGSCDKMRMILISAGHKMSVQHRRMDLCEETWSLGLGFLINLLIIWFISVIMKLYCLAVLYKGEGKVTRLAVAHDVQSFGYFQRSR